jgi:hypothetical protein
VERFISKKFNKLRKDLEYGPLEAIDSKMKKQHIKLAIERVKAGNHKTKECNFCSNTVLKDLQYPMNKVNKLFMEEYLHF